MASPLDDAAHRKRHVVLICEDMTEVVKHEADKKQLDLMRKLVTGVAHEMNTPLGVCRTVTSLLLGELYSLEGENEGVGDLSDMKSCCDLIDDNLSKANTLVASFKRLSATQMADEIQACDLGEVVEECAMSLAPLFHEKGLRVTVNKSDGGDLSWRGFPGHLARALVCVFENVAQHAYEGAAGSVEVSVDGSEDGERFKIECQDFGKGVSDEAMSHVFEPFFTTARAQGSSGLGLAIVHNLVTNVLMGTVGCRSEVGRGTTVSIHVPRDVARAEGGSTSSSDHE